MNLTVIKLGGHAMDDEHLLAAFMQDILAAKSPGQQIIIVHGGGPQINALLKRLDIKSEFVDGLRKTGPDTLSAVEMCLAGQVNKQITRRLLAAGVDAAGISGEDGGLLRARIRDERLGLVGEITEVNPAILTGLLASGFTPVVAPLATDASWQPLNVNADTAAGAIAGATKAAQFVLISDVPGVLNAQGDLVPKLDKEQIQAMIQTGAISGGMIPKVECCLSALAQGAGQAVILDGTRAHALADLLLHGKCCGTVVG